mmetsp:Transcript_22881/g.41565  ORF Transcript_22881/g.41565 Transcript_22881/m.41565 type:complete len:217 (-) Transcript_22881:190-840(-)|eukprot:CAMPEP_0202492438 /NCGR_PEP_ID=MMETSP1361-20130828/9148_1 /ASSEMBLY_ACC=CAM_ASM_000849 /TAXON_ID=210615 /ORGANISM="Staurosira complex sp., Strain CCMP2646" /LENGTH=216 /DNA_ID=CAMNT_0049122641 /DNA_START=46 /DNA_END=696 /DNA_ORIENTATION=+
MKRVIYVVLMASFMQCCRAFFVRRQVANHWTSARFDWPVLYSSSNDANSNITISSEPDSGSALTLQQQAQALRAEALSLERSLNETKAAKIQKQLDAVDRWIDELLINVTINEDTQMLNSVEQVTRLLEQKRFSQEHVNRIFDRICELSGPQSRSKCSPLVSLLVDASGKLDCVEREDNNNKRWNGKVERELRKRLFAADWGIELEPEDEKPERFL